MKVRAVMLLSLLATRAMPAAGQDVAIEALGDAEVWKTDPGSVLLARNGGAPSAVGEMYGWLAWQPAPALRFMAIAYAYGETGAGSDIDAQVQLLSLRWWRSRVLRLEGGRILLPIGEFAPRRFANANPLIGEPDTYVSEYPWGVSIAGADGAFDYEVAAVSLPAVNTRYTPEPSSRLRPVVGAGVTVGPQLHVGAAVTHGSYLNADDASDLGAGTSWRNFNQTVATLDVHYSVGRVDSRGEAAWSRYDVPTMTAPINGLGWYVESRVTLTPRWFAAGRYEHNRYPFVLPIAPGLWVGQATTQMNGEVGVGYRLTPDALIKTSLRKDHWPVHQISGTAFPDGYALAMQMSLHADLIALLQPRP